jgi:hypothetical protein
VRDAVERRQHLGLGHHRTQPSLLFIDSESKERAALALDRKSFGKRLATEVWTGVNQHSFGLAPEARDAPRKGAYRAR